MHHGDDLRRATAVRYLQDHDCMIPTASIHRLCIGIKGAYLARVLPDGYLMEQAL